MLANTDRDLYNFRGLLCYLITPLSLLPFLSPYLGICVSKSYKDIAAWVLNANTIKLIYIRDWYNY
jgi:hypothetical protein